MKKSILAIFAAVGMNALMAQTNNMGTQAAPAGVDAPATVTSKFSSDYPNTSANWRMDDDNYSAQYTDQTTNMDRSVVYDRNGNVIRTDNEIGKGTYPSTIGDYYTKNYPNQDYEVWASTDNNGTKSYYAKEKSGGTRWFDSDGKHVGNKPTKNKSTTKSTSVKSSNSQSNTSGQNEK